MKKLISSLIVAFGLLSLVAAPVFAGGAPNRPPKPAPKKVDRTCTKNAWKARNDAQKAARTNRDSVLKASAQQYKSDLKAANALKDAKARQAARKAALDKRKAADKSARVNYQTGIKTAQSNYKQALPGCKK